MLITVILAVIVGISGYFFGRKENDIVDMRWFFGIMGIMLGGLIGFGIALIIGADMPIEEQIDRTELVSLSNSSVTSGRFFLGSGRINDEMHYHYFYSDNGGFRYDNISAENDVIIFEEDREDAYLEKRKDVCVKKFSWFGVCSGRSDASYEFHIPEGSVLREYSVQ